MENMTGEEAYLALDGWAGITCHPVKIIGDTPKKYRVVLGEDTRLPGGRERKKGDTVLVPKDAVRFKVVTP